MDYKTLYYIPDGAGRISLSAYKYDDDMWEANHRIIDLQPQLRMDKISQQVEITILGNVLYQAGIMLVNG